MKRRRFFLTGLSAASVAGSLPLFARTAKAQGPQELANPSVKTRVELLRQRGRRLDLALMVKAEQDITLRRGVYSIESARIRWSDGRTMALRTEVPDPMPPMAMARRLPPRIPSITLAAQTEGELGRFKATLPERRALAAMVAFVVNVEGERHEATPIAIAPSNRANSNAGNRAELML